MCRFALGFVKADARCLRADADVGPVRHAGFAEDVVASCAYRAGEEEVADRTCIVLLDRFVLGFWFWLYVGVDTRAGCRKIFS